MPIHMVDTYAKFHRNISTKYRNVTSCKIGANGWMTMDRQQMEWMT